MYNAKVPEGVELPSSKQLVTSTLIALAAALVLLVSVILPAEYGIDLSGVGRVLGLTRMGEIKEQLANEAGQGALSLAAKGDQSEGQKPIELDVSNKDVAVGAASVNAGHSETRSIQLKPGEAAEIKLGIKKGDIVNYEWFVDTGHLNYDVHGDTVDINYFGYKKGKSATGDKGTLQAAFDGRHGWFWRNRSKQAVSVILIVSGDYSGIFRVL